MAVFEYKASMKDREDFFESGTIVARDELEARKKLQALKFDHIRLKRIGGVAGLLKRFTADIK